MQKRFIAIAVLLLIALTQVLPGQFQPTPVTRSTQKATINGQVFLLHEVLRGQTLYGITKAYQIPEEEIRKYNPELTQRSVYPGMVLRIPDRGTFKAENEEIQSNKYLMHKVKAKETLFSLSRKYGVKAEDLREANPDIRNGLKTGQVIRIPKDLVTVEQHVPVVVTEPDVTPAFGLTPVRQKDSIGGPCTLLPFPHQADTFRLAVLLPLNITHNDTLVFSDTLKSNYFRFYDFLEGLYLAVDSLQKQGMNLSMDVFDTGRNPDTVRNIMRNEDFRNADLIIGPVFTNLTEPVAAFARSKHIPMVSPFSTASIYRNNPYVFQVRNNSAREKELAVKYLSSLQNINLVILGRLSDRFEPELNRFSQDLAARAGQRDSLNDNFLKTIYFTEFARKFTNADSVGLTLSSFLSRTRPNYLVLPSDNEVFITEAINKLNQNLPADYDIHVFGMNPWAFTNIDLRNLFNVGLEVISDFEDNPYINSSDSLVREFNRKYKENWNIEPSKYSFQGFDTGYYFASALYYFGRNLTASVPCWNIYLRQPVLMTPMDFFKAGEGDGYLNDNLPVIRYRKEDLTLQRVN